MILRNGIDSYSGVRVNGGGDLDGLLFVANGATATRRKRAIQEGTL